MFKCTSDPTYRQVTRRRQKVYAFPWEFHVQSHVREIHPPVGPPYVSCRVGQASDGELVAVGQVLYSAPQDLYYVPVIAVALERRGQRLGLTLLNLLMDDAALAGAERGLSEVVIEGMVHEQNRASISVITRAGFQREPSEDQPEHKCYRVTVPTPDLTS